MHDCRGSIRAFASRAALVLVYALAAGEAAAGDGELRWSRISWPSPAITEKPGETTLGSDGSVYVTTYLHYLVALDPADGGQLWYRTDHPRTPAVGADGTVYSSSGSDLHAIDPADGSSSWTLPLGGAVTSPPAIGADGTVYIGVGADLVAVDPAAQAESWRLAVGGEISERPVIGPGGALYVVSDADLVAVGIDTHAESWRFSSGNTISAEPAVGDGGIVYVGSHTVLYAVNPDGGERWRFHASAYIVAAPAIGADGTLYLSASPFGEWLGFLFAIRPDGRELWRYATAYYNKTTPALGADGSVYLASDDVHLFALDRYGREKWRFRTFGNSRWNPTLAPDGTVYVGGSMGELYAVETSSGGPASSPWPMAGHDAQHTARNDVATPACIAPTITTDPANALIASGGTAMLSVAADGDEPLEINWYEGLAGDKTAPAGSGATLTTPALTQSTTWWVEVTNACGVTFSREATVSVGVPGQVRWLFKADEEVMTPPALGADGTVYFGDEAARLYAVNADGTERWTFNAYAELGPWGETNFLFCAPAVGGDGTIYVGSGGYYENGEGSVHFGILWAIAPDGTEKWRYETGEGSAIDWIQYGNPAVALDGTIYVMDNAGELHAVNADGTKRWSFATSEKGTTLMAPAIATDGTIYISTKAGHVHALHPDGTLAWTYDLGATGLSRAAPIIGAGGTIYTGAANGTIHAITPQGAAAWPSPFDVGDQTASSLAVGVDGTVYVSGVSYVSGHNRAVLFALAGDGTEKWRFPKAADPPKFGSFSTTPTVGADGIVYFGIDADPSLGGDGRLYAIDPDGNKVWQSSVSFGSIGSSSPLLAPDGTLYIGTGTGRTDITVGFMFAVHTGSFGVADSPWPSLGANAQHTGRAPGAEPACEPPLIVEQPSDVSIASGTTAQLGVEANGTALLDHRWYEGAAGDATNEVGVGETLTTAALTQSKTYWVRVTNACGEIDSEAATVTVTASGNCADVNVDGKVTAVDALYVLRTAVGSANCGGLDYCICNANGAAAVTAADALLVLKYAVGNPVSLNCPC